MTTAAMKTTAIDMMNEHLERQNALKVEELELKKQEIGALNNSLCQHQTMNERMVRLEEWKTHQGEVLTEVKDSIKNTNKTLVGLAISIILLFIGVMLKG